jgi:hypothetical protein
MTSNYNDNVDSTARKHPEMDLPFQPLMMGMVIHEY